MGSSFTANLTLIPQGAVQASISGDASVSADATVGQTLDISGDSTVGAALHVEYALSSSIISVFGTDFSGDAALTAEATVGLPAQAAPIGPTVLNGVGTPGAGGSATGGGTLGDSNWHSFSFTIPGKDALAKVRNILETLMIYLEVIKAILQTIQKFLIDFGNPIKALVEALLRLLNQLFELLKRTGIYGYFDVPNPLADPNFFKNLNGYAPFTTRFKASVLDVRDPNRPQPVAGATKSGFILFVVDATDALILMRKITQLLRFFGKDFLAPQYAAPPNFKALPVGAKGDPILSVVRVFAEQPSAIVLEWSMPTNPQQPDPGFTDIVTTLGTEFIPPSFLIERSSKPINSEVEYTDINVPSSVGPVVYSPLTEFEVRGKPGRRTTRKFKLTDQYGDPFVKFESYKAISGLDVTNILGQLGKFRFIDTNVEFDHTYYYRVRAFSGDLNLNATTGQLHFDIDTTKDVNSGTYLVRWPSVNPASLVVMGRPSQVARVRLSRFPPNFNVVDDLRRLFETAFSLNFHLPADPHIQFNGQGDPVNPDNANQIGVGSLNRQASALSALVNVPLIGLASSSVTNEKFTPNDATGQLPMMPWQSPQVVRQSARLANTVASALLEAGSGAIDQFRVIMQSSPLPKGVPAAIALNSANTIEKLVTTFTAVDENGQVTLAGAQLYGDVYGDAAFRKNILHAVQYILALTLGGTPPDWIKISILRDIIPWSGQMLYDLLAKMQALLDAFRGVLDEIKDFIDLLIRKIDALERFIQFLISILNFIESLQVGAFVLSLPTTTGGPQDWFTAIDNAGGTPPNPAPNGYQAGIALAYVAIDVDPLVAALKAIF